MLDNNQRRDKISTAIIQTYYHKRDYQVAVQERRASTKEASSLHVHRQYLEGRQLQEEERYKVRTLEISKGFPASLLETTL